MNRLTLTTILILTAALLAAACSKTPEPAAASLPAEESPTLPDRVTLTAEAAKTAGIEVAEAGPATIRQQLMLYGEIKPDPQRVRRVAARFAGVIKLVNVGLGERVRAGQTLALIESNDSLTPYALTAPIAGVVTERDANPGENAGERSLFVITDLSRVWVQLAAFRRDLSRLRLNQRVTVHAQDAGNDADIGPDAETRLDYIAPGAEDVNQSVMLRATLDNVHGRWLPGQFVVGEVTVAEDAVPVAVRSEALQQLDGKPVVFVVEGETYRAQTIVSGRRDAQFVEIREGLAASARYVAAGSYVLKAEIGKGAIKAE